jgi:hypothetical protein
MNIAAQLTEALPKGYRKYRIKGLDKDIIARKGGPTAKQVKTKASYKVLRDNQKEFGVASMMCKTFRESLTSDMSEICETYLSGRLTAEFRKLAKFESGKTGTRPIYLTKYGQQLSGFEFNSEAPYKEIFGAKYFVKQGSERGQVILHFPSFIPDHTFKAPQGATNFKINARLVALSDFCFDKEVKDYRAVNQDFHGKFASWQSTMLPILKIPTDPMTTQLSILPREIPGGTTLFLVMAVSFYHYENGRFTHLSKGSCMQIEQVY